MKSSGKYSTAESRWAGVGPYYAMFPVSFSDRVVKNYTKCGDGVLDPFAGRGTTLFSAVTNDRIAVGSEINPVGWVYGQAKLHPAVRIDVEDRIASIGKIAHQYKTEASKLPPFFKLCYSDDVLNFLVAARNQLNWRRNKADWTAMALILVDLHGKIDSAFSNQMRQTKSMSPDYSIEWWKANKMKPPKRQPVEFMMKKIAWRYAKGDLSIDGGSIYLGDSRQILKSLSEKNKLPHGAKLLLTSPPYYGITNY
ncbi:MAG TPA: DNA methyltransferase, partial [Candidatus Kapabacteria bacterium]|nr:DNA methyltransferase [Candidatus Kapabacteria bacterium]